MMALHCPLWQIRLVLSEPRSFTCSKVSACNVVLRPTLPRLKKLDPVSTVFLVPT